MPKPRKDYTEDEERDQIIQRETENFNQHQAHFSDGRHTDDESSKMPDIEDRLTSREYTAGGKLKKALEALIKELPKKISDESEYDKPKWKSPDEMPLDELDHTDVHGLAERGNSRLGNTDEVLGDSIVQNTSSHGDVQSNVGRKIRERGHGDKSGMQATMSRRNAEILRSNTKKALETLTKEMIGVGSGIRGGGSSYAHTQGQGNSTQVTIVPPRPEDDRVASKKVKNRKE